MGREPPQGYPPVAGRREAVARVVRLPPPYRFIGHAGRVTLPY